MSGRTRLARALRAGSVAHATSTLALALLLTPWVAAETNFGHSHPNGTPPHVHVISGVFTPAAPPALAAGAVAVPLPSGRVARMDAGSPPAAPLALPHRGRAPPSATQPGQDVILARSS